MNGDHADMDEPMSEMDGETDPNKQNNQSDQTDSSQYVPNKLEHLTNGLSCQNSTTSAIHDNEESGDEKTIEKCINGQNGKSGISEHGFSENKTCDEEDEEEKSSNDIDSLKEDKSRADSNSNQCKNSESMACTKSIDETDSQEMLEISDKIEDKLLITVEHLSNNDSQEILPGNSNQDSENTNNSDNSLDSHEVMKSEENKIIMLEEKVTANSRESTHDSEEESFQYVDDAEDPISSSDPKNLIDKIDNKSPGTGMFKIVTVDRCYESDEDSTDSSRWDDSSRPGKIVNIDLVESSPDRNAVNIGSRESSPDSRDHLKNDIVMVDSAQGQKRKKSNPFEIDHIKQSDVIILDADQVFNRDKSPVIHEICSDNSDNDDCVVTSVEKIKTTKKNVTTTELRRSNRVIKRKKYSDDFDDTGFGNGSDVKLVSEDPLQTKQSKVRIIPKLPAITIKPTNNKIICNKKGNMSTSQSFSGKNLNTTKSNLSITKCKVNPVLVQNVFQKPIKNKDTPTIPVTTKSTEEKEMPNQVIQPEPLLPTLTDDMFVVEAPSFIVPYVYEKPAVVPFKAYVEKWGKEIEEQKLKEEQELLEKKKIEKEKDKEERKRKREQESEHEGASKKTRADKSERKKGRRKRNDEDDVSWDGSSSEESDDESISDDEYEIVTTAAGVQPKVDSFFNMALGEFFTGIGTKLVQEYVQTDLLHQETHKLKREMKSGHVTKSRALSVALLTNDLQLSKATNAQYKFEQKKCKFCSFRTESELVLQHHLETPHMKNNEYLCNFCSLVMPNAMNMLFHMDEQHGVKGKLERAPAPHQCTNCSFEDHGKSKLGRHLTTCAKKFKPETNLAPPIDWEHPAKIPKLSQPRPAMYQAPQTPRIPMGSGTGTGRFPVTNALTPRQFRPVRPLHIRGTILRPRTTAAYNALNSKRLPNCGYVISTAPRLTAPTQPLNPSDKDVVMCEICDGYIKNLEKLRVHMAWIHKVKIHPRMINNRPPLNCQKCQFRFLTDQGLERHLLGSHGLVTTAIQDAANRGKDSGRCPVCGRVYQRKLLAHVSRDHNLVLKPAHLSYKCTVCSATFGMYCQFENHVYSEHSVAGKKLSEKKVVTPDKADASTTTSAKEDTKSIASDKETTTTATIKENTEAKKNTVTPMNTSN